MPSSLQRLEKNPDVRVGQVDCVENSHLCAKYGVTSYPTIRMYPLDSPGHSRYQKYQQYHRDATSLHQWVTASLPSYVENLTPHLFEHSVLEGGGEKPWLVMFFTPWCGHCTRFSPDYEEVAVMMRSRLRAGKVNCEKYRRVCERAAVTGFPTVRFYRGGRGQQQYSSQDITERSPANIVQHLQRILREDTDTAPQSEEKPLSQDQDMKKIPLGGSEAQEDDTDTDYEEAEMNNDFTYFYEDDILSYHDEL